MANRTKHEQRLLVDYAVQGDFRRSQIVKKAIAVLHKSGCLSTSQASFRALAPTDFLKDRQVMYAFIDCNRGRYTVEMMARVFRISPRSYYDHKRGKHNLREQRREALERLIQQVYAAANRRSKQEQSQACLSYALQGGGKRS